MSVGYDSVVMLTWSDWKTEPRSNRFHYASRFARRVPVLFVQPDAGPALEETTELPNVILLHAGSRYHEGQLEPVARALAARGLTRPLVWAYNPRYEAVGRWFPGATRVFHATEDYFRDSTFLGAPSGSARYAYRCEVLEIQRRLVATLQENDLVVCVSPGVAEGVRGDGCYAGTVLLLENGCDFAFWAAGARPAPSPKVALYQGGINERLDAALILDVMRRLPDWQFRFCGRVSPSFADWPSLRAAPNFVHVGSVDGEALREELRAAGVGLMPYRQVRSLTGTIMPLKAFEYAASGLPVVSVPIDSIAHLPQVFRFASTAEAFAEAIVSEAPTRADEARFALRQDAARAQDYDIRFEELQRALSALAPRPRARATASLRISALAAGQLWNRALSRITSFARL